MNLLQIVTIFSLVLSGANWLLFVALAMMAQRALTRSAPQGNATDEAAAASPRVRPEKLADATGGLAKAFGIAGPSASAAAMSLVCLLIAALAAGADKF